MHLFLLSILSKKSFFIKTNKPDSYLTVYDGYKIRFDTLEYATRMMLEETHDDDADVKIIAVTKYNELYLMANPFSGRIGMVKYDPGLAGLVKLRFYLQMANVFQLSIKGECLQYNWTGNGLILQPCKESETKTNQLFEFVYDKVQPKLLNDEVALYDRFFENYIDLNKI